MTPAQRTLLECAADGHTVSVHRVVMEQAMRALLDERDSLARQVDAAIVAWNEMVAATGNARLTDPKTERLSEALKSAGGNCEAEVPTS